ncbi:AbrB family transcriptional regulator [Nitrososphaera sp. AFS]|uniref:AbrB family transcriptional regulator n=1 Tax=Nitrososphaera sp. AFS TaxID=2301191 RepID=UPI00139221D6|nr:AbrB family transcriptional regulator [Nitrososphaera sp. AFS]NAL78279.1 AbrB family transcriptional regulator [Nitrososphaera sp. AFS]
MGEITSLAKNAKSFASLRTTIPISIVRQWKLKSKDKLYWEWEIRDGNMVAVVRKHEEKSKRKTQK